MELRIKVNVKNPTEIIKSKKGPFVGLFADLILSEGKKIEKIEKEIYRQIQEQLLEDLPEILSEEGVIAEIECDVVDNELLSKPDLSE